MQTHLSPQIRNKILIPLIKEEELRKKNIAKKAKATKVDFFTLVRGDNL
jgi:alpha-D-ribose 1-methylphosphonate 5-triphosphate synthase subunit PhnG